MFSQYSDASFIPASSCELVGVRPWISNLTASYDKKH